MTVIGIYGPTASGKSRVAEALGERIPSDLVSADAMQVYRGLPILTNQESSRSTRLVGIWALDEEASVGAYAPLAHLAIDEILAEGRTPIVVGGTGLYLRAALAELELPPPPSPGARERWGRLYDENPAAAHERLGELDPAAAVAVHPNDRRRVVRALELAEAGASLVPDTDRLWAELTRHPTVIVGLEVPKDVLERRIEARTRAMFEAGVEEEVRRALAGRVSATARKTLGIDEVATLPRDEAIDAIAVRTRKYAAYQRKWMRRVPGLVMVDADRPPGEIADDILALARPRERIPRR